MKLLLRRVETTLQGNYKKYKSAFVNSLTEDQTEGNAELLMDVFLASMEEVCERCMSNRMMCALRPECPNRIFLNLLIKFRVDIKDLPGFCYTQQLNNVKTFLEGGPKTQIFDTTLPITEFLNILSGGARGKLVASLHSGNIEKLAKDLFTEIKRATPEVLTSIGNDYILALVDDELEYFDLSNETVIISPQDTIIKSKEILRGLIDIYRERYKLDLEVKEDFEGIWYLNIFIPIENSQNKDTGEINKILGDYEKKLSSTDYVSNYFSDNKVNLTIEIKPPIAHQKNNLTFKKIMNIFTQINNLIKEINQLLQA